FGYQAAPGESGQDDQQGIALTDECKALGIVRMGTGQQPWCVEEFHGRGSDLLGIVKLRQELQPWVRERRHANLPGMDLPRVRAGASQEFEQGTLAAPGEADDSNLHPTSPGAIRYAATGRTSRRRAVAGENGFPPPRAIDRRRSGGSPPGHPAAS